MKSKYIMMELYCPVERRIANLAAGSRLVEAFGGITVVEGTGLWVNPDNSELVDERVLIQRVVAKEDTAKYLHSIAEQYKAESGEHTVMYCIGTEAFFI